MNDTQEYLINNYMSQRNGANKRKGQPLLLGPPITETHPEKLPFWDYAKNKPGPQAYSYGAKEIVHWLCPANADHAWEQRINQFLCRQTDCMECARRPILDSYRLSTRFPKIAKEWHPQLNRLVKPEHVNAVDERRAWWQCAKRKSHVFCAPVRSRTVDNLACPFCTAPKVPKTKTFANVRPTLAKLWDVEKSHNLKPSDVTADCPFVVHFFCPQTVHLPSPHNISTSVNKATKDGLDCYVCRREPKKQRSLDITNPELIPQWHKKKNRKLTPSDVTAGSSRLVWWKCAEAFDHEWRVSVNTRARSGAGCPFCAGNRTSSTQSFAIDRPDLLEQWHTRKNRNVDPHSIPARYNFKVFWQCPVSKKHVWEASVTDRVHHNSGCPYCSGRVIASDTNLAALYPKAAALWHPTKNGDLTPHDVTPGSGRYVFFQCKRFPEHVWNAVVASKPEDCPKCLSYRWDKKTSLKALYPKIARQWHSTKNAPITPDCVSPHTKKKFWWVCPKNLAHAWEATAQSRVRMSSGCPVCANKIMLPENSLAAHHPKVASFWDKKKNGAWTPWQVAPKSQRIFWWTCTKGPDHQWQSTPAQRTKNESGCPMCAGWGFSITHTPAYAYPEIAKQWHPTKNGKVTTSNVKCNDRRSFWWVCPTYKHHVFTAAISDRIKAKSPCPICKSFQLRPGNTLQDLYPDIASQWHDKKNKNLTPNDVSAHSSKRVYWRCSIDATHFWQATVGHRTGGKSGCPQCKSR